MTNHLIGFLFIFIPTQASAMEPSELAQLESVQAAYIDGNWKNFADKFREGIKNVKDSSVRTAYFDFYEAAKSQRADFSFNSQEAEAANINLVMEVNQALQGKRTYHLVITARGPQELEGADIELPQELRQFYLDQRFIRAGGAGVLNSQPAPKQLPPGLYESRLRRKNQEPISFSFLITPESYRVLDISLLEPKKNLILSRNEILEIKFAGLENFGRDAFLIVTFVDPVLLSAVSEKRFDLNSKSIVKFPIDLPVGTYDAYIELRAKNLPSRVLEAATHYRWIVPLRMEAQALNR